MRKEGSSITQEISINNLPHKIKIYIADKEFNCKVRFSIIDLNNFYEQREAGETGKEAVVESIFKNLLDAEGYNE